MLREKIIRKVVYTRNFKELNSASCGTLSADSSGNRGKGGIPPARAVLDGSNCGSEETLKSRHLSIKNYDKVLRIFLI